MMADNSVPVIDVAPLVSGDGARSHEAVRRIRAACQDWGFFQIYGHGIPEELIDRVCRETKHFFALPPDAKRSISRSKDNPRGYYNRELTKNIRDMKEVFDFGHKPHPELPDDDPVNLTRDGYNQWPDAALCPDFKATMMAYYRACEAVALKLLEAIAQGLGFPSERLTRDFVGKHTSFLRLNYYPCHDPLTAAGQTKQAAATGHLGVHHHTDAGAITVLLQDKVGGLQVCRNAEWFHVEPVVGALVVNIGDIVQVWTNDLYRAPLHRVLASEHRERYSLPFFYNPSYDTEYYPLDVVTSDESPPNYAHINWGEFRWQRQQGDYADYGKEIQISDYRLRASIGSD
ncbi:MAG: isopenicillin N synthase family dioxygenase [Acidiferrobacterales bacterium]